jgi:zinc transporter ZupT
MALNSLNKAIHNFPEGLATFAAAIQDPAAGAVFAIGKYGQICHIST